MRINSSISDTKPVTCGVPQGSVLGPLLFIMYTNDLQNSLKHTHAILFADDTAIYTKANTLITLYENVNSDLDTLNEWFETNKLSRNVAKTHYMLFTNNTRAITNSMHKLKIGNAEIEQKKT